MMSSMCSVPIERRTVVGLISCARSSSPSNWLCVVDAG